MRWKMKLLGVKQWYYATHLCLLEMAERFVELFGDFFSGVVTLKKAIDVQEVARRLPLDKILVETDAILSSSSFFQNQRLVIFL